MWTDYWTWLDLNSPPYQFNGWSGSQNYWLGDTWINIFQHFPSRGICLLLGTLGKHSTHAQLLLGLYFYFYGDLNCDLAWLWYQIKRYSWNLKVVRKTRIDMLQQVVFGSARFKFNFGASWLCPTGGIINFYFLDPKSIYFPAHLSGT